MYRVLRFARLQNHAHSHDDSCDCVLAAGFVTGLRAGVLGGHGRVWLLDGVAGFIECRGGRFGVLFGKMQRVGGAETRDLAFQAA